MISCLLMRRISRCCGPCEPYSADNHNILHSMLLKLIKSVQPELGALIFADGKRQRFLPPATGQSKNDISGFLTITPLSPTEIVNSIDVNDRINIIKRPVLPFLNLHKYLVCDIGNRTFRNIKVLNVFNGGRGRNLTGCHSLCIY